MKRLDRDEVRRGSRLEEIIPALTGQALPKPNGRAEPAVICPFHDDQQPSLRINIEKQVWHCDPCNIGGDVFSFVERYQQTDFAGALRWLAERAGLEREPPKQPKADRKNRSRREVATYDYRDEKGALLFQAVRYSPKDFRQRRPDGTRGWIWNLNGVRRVLYRLHDLQGKEDVVIVEGEKDADALWAIGIPATCNVGGAGRWLDEYSQQLGAAGCKRVVVSPDNDDLGRQHAERVAANCSKAIPVKVLTLPNVPEKGDVSDYLARHTAVELRALLTAAPLYQQQQLARPPEQADLRADDEAAEREARDATREIRIAEEMERERARREARRRLDAEARGGVTAPEILTLRERLARPRQSTQYRINSWQPCGSRVVLAAQFKSGKTTLIGELVRSLVDGDPWLGRDTVTPIAGTVALIDTEMSPAQLDDWLRVRGISHDDRVLVVPLRGQAATLDLLDSETRALWVTRLRAHGVAYLIVDCLRPILDALGLDEHRDVGRWLVALDALLVEAGIPECCVVQHMGHMGERSRGDSRLRDWPDVEWRLVRQDDDPASPRFLTAYGRDVDMAESQLTYDPQTRTLTIAGGSRQDVRTRPVLDAILDVLAASPPMSGRAIKKALADSDGAKAIDTALRYGVEHGEIVAADGPRRAKLYRPVSQCPPVSPECPNDTASECPVPLIERDTRTLIPGAEAALSHRDTGQPFYFDGDPFGDRS